MNGVEVDDDDLVVLFLVKNKNIPKKAILTAYFAFKMTIVNFQTKKLIFGQKIYIISRSGLNFGIGIMLLKDLMYLSILRDLKKILKISTFLYILPRSLYFCGQKYMFGFLAIF